MLCSFNKNIPVFIENWFGWVGFTAAYGLHTATMSLLSWITDDEEEEKDEAALLGEVSLEVSFPVLMGASSPCRASEALGCIEPVLLISILDTLAV